VNQPDIEYLRGQLADRLDRHSMRNWSAPLLAAVIGVLDAHFMAEERRSEVHIRRRPGLIDGRFCGRSKIGGSA
jgi:hypothetical protein